MKEALTLTNHAGGTALADVNKAIAQASAALDADGNKGSKATVTLTIALENKDEGGELRTVSTHVAVKAPPTPKRAVYYPVQKIDGKRVLVVDADQEGAQLRIPTGVANIEDKRAAS